MENWFYTGKVMEDGKTKITVCARGEVEIKKYLEKGWRPLKAKKREKRVDGHE
ncbi:MAG: hypothetical protein HYS21_13750 [Deltaproteobacteria bacterium]|nr:hypothetical protein [Deltaproteobacteria bacterium]